MVTLKRTLLGAAAGVLLSAGAAPAFYFPGWPGSGEPIRRSLIPPKVADRPGNPPSTPPLNTPTPGRPEGNPPPFQDIPPTPGDQPPPEHVPEPATGLLGLIGLSAAAAARRLRRGRE